MAAGKGSLSVSKPTIEIKRVSSFLRAGTARVKFPERSDELRCRCLASSIVAKAAGLLSFS